MKENKEIIFFLLGMFILVGLAYEPAKEGKFRQTNNTVGSGGSYVTSDPYYMNNTNNNWYGTSQNSTTQKPEDIIKNIEVNVRNLQIEADKNAEEEKRSPYYRKITMSYISSVGNPDPNYEYIYLYTNLGAGERLNITGWYLKSDVTNYFATIGGATLLPYPYTKNETDLVLQSGDTVILSKGFSPIGTSFRTNKCTGYFEEDREFIPNLQINCPRPIDEKLPKFSSDLDRQDECLDLIKSVPYCSTVKNSYIKKLPDTVTSSCKDYLKNKINYNTCVANHFSDTDFPGNEYRIYLNKFGPLWRTKRETIRLYDRNGLIVDTMKIY